MLELDVSAEAPSVASAIYEVLFMGRSALVILLLLAMLLAVMMEVMDD